MKVDLYCKNKSNKSSGRTIDQQGENAGIFYFLQKSIFANFEFIFAIRDLKPARESVENTQDTTQNRGKVLLLS